MEAMALIETRRDFLRSAALAMAAVKTQSHLKAADGRKPPNFVLIFLDDSGWADFHPFGDPAYQTPNVERLARQGCSFHNFYVPQAICSASRSALLSGCYPGRTKVVGAHPPRARGLDPKFATMGQVLKARGYRTAVFGKWHIGDQPDTRPPARGYDESCGLMYSNDMWEYHPENPQAWGKYPLQFWDNGKVTIERVTKEHQAMLTTWYTEHAVDFIRRNKGNPFLLYVPHNMPHVPIFASEKFKGKSGTGLYGDVMMEIDWSVGEIMKALKDGGPRREHAGLLQLRQRPLDRVRQSCRENAIPRGQSHQLRRRHAQRLHHAIPGPDPRPARSPSACSATVDMLPTMARLAGAKLPDNPIDGRDVWDIIRGQPGAKNPHDYYPFSTGANFEGVISADGHWKLHLPHKYITLDYAGKDGKPGKYTTKQIELSLFDMEKDPHETTNAIGKYPTIAERLKGYAEEHRAQFYANSPAP